MVLITVTHLFVNGHQYAWSVSRVFSSPIISVEVILCAFCRLVMCTNREELYEKSEWEGKGLVSRRKLMGRLQCEYSKMPHSLRQRATSKVSPTLIFAAYWYPYHLVQ